MWRRAMVYLGLDDAEYETAETEEGEEPERGGGRDRSSGSRQGAVAATPSQADEPTGIGTVRPIQPLGADGREVAPLTGQTAKPSGGGVGGPSRPRPQVVRPIPATPNAKPHVVMPTSFNQAQELADKYKGSQPVIMNLQGADRDLSRRLIDFASGLCYGLGGQMERVANQVYLLTPTDVEVSPEERRRLHERGYDT